MTIPLNSAKLASYKKANQHEPSVTIPGELFITLVEAARLQVLLDEVIALLPAGWHFSNLFTLAADGGWTAAASLACPDDGDFGCAGFREVVAGGLDRLTALEALRDKIVANADHDFWDLVIENPAD
jgi:hypothetical protein